MVVPAGTALRHGHAVHGKASREYASWMKMIARCTNPRGDSYHLYGGRGIRVCARWRESFEAFLYDMGPRPAGTSIDRIDNNGHYEPGNCRWASEREQHRNTRRNRFLTWRGETLCLADWAARVGLCPKVLGARLRSGWTVERALATPKLGPAEVGRLNGERLRRRDLGLERAGGAW